MKFVVIVGKSKTDDLVVLSVVMFTAQFEIRTAVIQRTPVDLFFHIVGTTVDPESIRAFGVFARKPETVSGVFCRNGLSRDNRCTSYRPDRHHAVVTHYLTCGRTATFLPHQGTIALVQTIHVSVVGTEIQLSVGCNRRKADRTVGVKLPLFRTGLQIDAGHTVVVG